MSAPLTRRGACLSVAFQEIDPVMNRKHISHKATVLILGLGCAVSVLMAIREKGAVESRERKTVALATHRITSELQLELARQGAACDSVAAFFAASEYVSPDEFQLFTSEILRKGSAVQAVEWVEFVRQHERARWENVRGFEITERGLANALDRAGERPSYAPVVYAAPLRGNESAVGFDLLAEPDRRSALKAACETVKSAATAPIRIIQDDSTAILIARPVYAGGVEPAASADPCETLMGWAVTVVRPSDFLSRSVLDVIGAVEIVDVSDALDERVLLRAGMDGLGSRATREVHSIHVGMLGRSWRIDGIYEASGGWDAFRITLLVGLLTTALLTSHFNATRRIYNSETSLREKNAEIEQRNREIQSFYHAVSHELKTPLASAREFASLIHDGIAGPVSEEQREFADYMIESCDQMTRYVNDMLDVARIETGKLNLKVSPVAVADLVKQPACAAERACREKNIHFALHVPAGLPRLCVDAHRIQQALSNLLTNAVKFTRPDGRVTLSISQGATRDQVMISVGDTGIGIARSDQEWVFERLSQASREDAARGVDGGGIGLGLAITREIVLLHGGAISLESEVNVGTTFNILLPVAVAEDVANNREKLVVGSQS